MYVYHTFQQVVVRLLKLALCLAVAVLAVLALQDLLQGACPGIIQVPCLSEELSISKLRSAGRNDKAGLAVPVTAEFHCQITTFPPFCVVAMT